jgi:hypothetical protein
MRYAQRRARVVVETGEPRRQSLMHDDTRLASRAGDGVEAGELRGMRFAQRQTHAGAEAGEPRWQPLVCDKARPASRFRGTVLGRWAYQARCARRSATGLAKRGMLLPTSSHAAAASQLCRKVDAFASCD